MQETSATTMNYHNKITIVNKYLSLGLDVFKWTKLKYKCLQI